MADPDTVDDDGRDGALRRPAWMAWLHGTGVALALVALAMRGLDSPAVGFPFAIAILAGLGVRSSPKPLDPDTLRMIHGSVLGGGIRQGAFIKSMFAVALLYMGLFGWASATASGGLTDVLLGGALGISALASEFETLQIRRVLEGSG